MGSGVSRGLYSAVSAMNSAQARVDVAASNLANLSTNGFKRSGTATHSFEARLRAGHEPMLSTSEAIDYEQGLIARTGNPYDLALYGEGFFAIDTPAGERFTRDGHFNVGEDGVLKTQDGHPVAWAQRGGAIDPTGLPVSIGADGRVSQGTQELGRLRIANFADARALGRDESGRFYARRGALETPFTAELHQGALESSNVNAVREMIDLIAVQRAFEGAANVLNQIDQSYRRLSRPQ